MRKLLYLFPAIALLAACGGNQEKKQVVTEETTTENAVVDYNIPSPSDQFGLLNELDGKLNLKALNDPSKSDSYGTVTAKALNFGAYTADIAYLTAYKNTDQYLTYFGKLEKMGSEIGVAQVFGKEMNDLAKKYTGNSDSLLQLSNETYRKTFNRLIEVDKGNDLSLMLIGGWVESLHLMIESSTGNSPLLEQSLADQKIVGENLLSFLGKYESNADVKKYTDEVRKIVSSFDKLSCSNGNTTVKKEGKSLSFSGGDSCTMTKACWEALKSSVEDVRNQITTAK